MTGRIGTTVDGWLLRAAGWLLIVTPIVTLTGCQQSRPVAAGAEGAETVAVAETALPENQMVYPWSVVPGGVDSAKAMGKAMEADPVVGAHYAGLQPGFFHPERLAEKKQGYVSYRIRDKIYWTRRMVTLAAGEQVLTDGKTLVRGRCGNLFSETPREPVAASADEPPEKKMDEPVRAAQLMPTPEMRAEAPVEIEKFENPKGFGENASNGSVLPTPQAEEALPPVWVAGTGIGGPGGVMGIGGMGGGGGASAGAPDATTPETSNVGTSPLTIPQVTPSTAFTIPPPLVLTALTHPPSTPLILEYPVFTPPELLYPPVLSPQPPQIWMPPVSVPPPSRPPVVENPPPGTPPGTPPTVPPPGTPPGDTPPGGPPPPGTPPSGPPPSGPPPFDPPPTTPPDVSVPEPAAWVLAVLGIGAILAGSWRRKR